MVSDRNKKKIFLTGASGYIGQDLLERLLKSHYYVKVLVRDKNKIKKYWEYPNLEIIQGDLIYSNQINLSDCNIVLHLAAELNQLSKKKNQGNLIALKNLLSNLKENKGIHFIYFSSVDAVGPIEEDKVYEFPRPLTEYGRAKLMGEKLVQGSGVNHTIFRIGNVYEKDAGIPQTIKNISKSETFFNRIRISILANQFTNCSLALIHKKDLLEIILSSILNKNLYHQTFFVSSQSVKIHEIFRKMNLRPYNFFGQKFIFYIIKLVLKFFRIIDIVFYIGLGYPKRCKREFDSSDLFKKINYYPKYFL